MYQVQYHMLCVFDSRHAVSGVQKNMYKQTQVAGRGDIDIRRLIYGVRAEIVIVKCCRYRIPVLYCNTTADNGGKGVQP